MGLFQDYIEGVAMRNNPQLLQNKLAGIESNRMAQMADRIYGNRGQAAIPEQRQQMAGPLMPGQARPDMEVTQQAQAATPGTGMFDQSIPERDRMMLMNKRMLGSGIDGFNKQWSQNQGNMQNSMMNQSGAMARQMQGQQYDTANPTQSAMMKNVAASGYAQGSPAFQAAMKRQLAKPGMSISMSKVAQPLNTNDLAKWSVPNEEGGWKDPTPGMSMVDIGNAGGRMKTQLAPGDVGKYMMLKGAQEEFNTIEGIYDEDGELDEKILFELTAQDWDPTGIIGAKMSSSKGQQIFGALERGMQGITRTETGAAMPAEEVHNTKKRFMPKMGDKKANVAAKIRAYKYFINNAVDLMNPQGLNRNQMTPEQATAAMNKAVDKSFEATNKTERKPGDVAKAIKAKQANDDKYEYRTLPDGTEQRRLK